MTTGRMILETIRKQRTFSLRLFVQGMIIGIVAGSLITLLRMGLEAGFSLLNSTILQVQQGHAGAIAAWIGLILTTAGFLTVITRKEPLVAGSGIPHIKAIISRDLPMPWARIIVLKLCGTIAAVGMGLGLGRQGPSVQIGGAVGEAINRLFKGTGMEGRILVTSGASAGLAAAFNAPLAGVIFAVEEIHKNFSPPVLLTAMTASVTADVLAQRVWGVGPLFDFQAMTVLPLTHYGLLFVAGLASGMAGLAFVYLLLKSLALAERLPPLLYNNRILLALLLTVPIGIWAPDSLGDGSRLIQLIHGDSPGLLMVMAFLSVRFLLTSVGYASGAPGGLFMPSLAIGGLMGLLIGDILVFCGYVEPVFLNNFVIFAMAGFLTAVIKAPISSSVLVSELTGTFQHLPALLLVCIVAYLLSDLLRAGSIYDLLLLRDIKRSHGSLGTSVSRRKTVIESLVNVGSELDGRLVREIIWPHSCLLVNIRRGEAEIIPRGDTLICAGDYVQILTAEKEASANFKILTRMSATNNR